jgi:hypothetical protein
MYYKHYPDTEVAGQLASYPLTVRQLTSDNGWKTARAGI